MIKAIAMPFKISEMHPDLASFLKEVCEKIAKHGITGVAVVVKGDKAFKSFQYGMGHDTDDLLIAAELIEEHYHLMDNVN